jgi:hypothetical protein
MLKLLCLVLLLIIWKILRSVRDHMTIKSCETKYQLSREIIRRINEDVMPIIGDMRFTSRDTKALCAIIKETTYKFWKRNSREWRIKNGIYYFKVYGIYLLRHWSEEDYVRFHNECLDAYINELAQEVKQYERRLLKDVLLQTI